MKLKSHGHGAFVHHHQRRSRCPTACKRLVKRSTLKEHSEPKVQRATWESVVTQEWLRSARGKIKTKVRGPSRAFAGKGAQMELGTERLNYPQAPPMTRLMTTLVSMYLMDRLVAHCSCSLFAIFMTVASPVASPIPHTTQVGCTQHKS